MTDREYHEAVERVLLAIAAGKKHARRGNTKTTTCIQYDCEKCALLKLASEAADLAHAIIDNPTGRTP